MSQHLSCSTCHWVLSHTHNEWHDRCLRMSRLIITQWPVNKALVLWSASPVAVPIAPANRGLTIMYPTPATCLMRFVWMAMTWTRLQVSRGPGPCLITALPWIVTLWALQLMGTSLFVLSHQTARYTSFSFVIVRLSMYKFISLVNEAFPLLNFPLIWKKRNKTREVKTWFRMPLFYIVQLHVTVPW